MYITRIKKVFLSVILLCSLFLTTVYTNGSQTGKTTTSAKLAKLLKKQGKNPLLVAADIYRPAAISQLKIVGEQAGVPVFEMGTEKPEIIEIEVNNHNAKYEFAVFADSVINDKPMEMGAEEGAKTVATCLAIVESSKTGTPIKPDYKF